MEFLKKFSEIKNREQAKQMVKGNVIHNYFNIKYNLGQYH